MKSAYELAMERLSKSEPTVQLTPEQKKQIAELESVYAAKIADREFFLKGQMQKVAEVGDAATMEQLEKQLVSDRKSLQAQLQEEKEKVRQSKKE